MQQRQKLSLTLSVGACLAASGIGAGHDVALAQTAQSNSALKATLQKLYAQQDAAAARKDAAGLFASYSPSFVGSSPSGRSETLAADEADFAHISSIAHSIATTSLVQSVTSQGKTALATVKLHVSIVLPNPQTQQLGTLGVDTVLHDTWTKTPAGWKLTMSKSLSEQDTFNGQPLGQTAPPPPPTPATPSPATPAPSAPATPAAPAAPDSGTTPAAPAPPSTAPGGS